MTLGDIYINLRTTSSIPAHLGKYTVVPQPHRASTNPRHMFARSLTQLRSSSQQTRSITPYYAYDSAERKRRLLAANSVLSSGKLSLSFMIRWLMAIHPRNRNGIKIWKLFKNVVQTSPTSTIRKHFEHEHLHTWKSECDRLAVPQKEAKEAKKPRPVPSVGPDGFKSQIVEFQNCEEWPGSSSTLFRSILASLTMSHSRSTWLTILASATSFYTSARAMPQRMTSPDGSPWWRALKRGRRSGKDTAGMIVCPTHPLRIYVT